MTVKSLPGLLLPVFTVILLAAGQLSAKQGASLQAAGNSGLIFLMLSYGCYMLRGISWTGTLRSMPVSRAYPILASGYPLILVLSALIFHEGVSPVKVAGAGFITLGVILSGASADE